MELDLLSLVEKSAFEIIWFFHLPSGLVMGRVSAGPYGTLHVVFDQQFSFDKHATFEALVPGVGEEPDRIQ